MSRGLWFIAGAGAGIYAVIRGRRAAEVLTADGLADRLSGAAVGLRMFRDEVAQGRVEKETELRQRWSNAPHGSSTPELTGPGSTSTTPGNRSEDDPEDHPENHPDEEGST